MKKKTGVYEWATHSLNIQKGCEHGCLYCYARYNAVERFHQCTQKEWENPVIDWDKVNKTYGKKEGVIFFPSSHDITPTNLDACIIVLRKLLAAGNKVLIVSKPHEKIIKLLCHLFQDHKEQILFRFTIGGFDDDILGFWEPGAPTYGERYRALYFACNNGFKTSVSCEPLLQPASVGILVKMLEDVITDTIWIGTANKLFQRTTWMPNPPLAAIERLEHWQMLDRMREIYEQLKDNPKIRWKDSYKKALGLKAPEKAGMDI